MKSSNFLLIFSGPSGAGKTTLCQSLLHNYPDLSTSISVTTRKPRAGEIDGKNYFFVSLEEYNNLLKDNKFLEHAKVFDNYYGTLISQIDISFQNKKNVVFDIDYQGMQQIKNKNIFNVVTIFVLPPSIAELKNRLIKRGDSEESINFRMKSFDEDIKIAENYDYILTNDNLDEIKHIIDSIYIAERYKFSKQKILLEWQSLN